MLSGKFRAYYEVKDTTGNRTLSKQRELNKPSRSSKEANDLETYPSEGYKRADFLRTACKKYGTQQNPGKTRGSYNHQHNAFYCPLCKIASTYWTRFFKMMELNEQGQNKNTPFDVPIGQAPPSNQFLNISSQLITPQNYSAKDSFRFLVVRSPYSLLFSAFVDKIVGPNPELWSSFGKTAISISRGSNISSCGEDVTYEEFLRYVVHEDNQKHKLNCHVAKFDACLPCETNYTFIVKMETLKVDTFYILSKLNQTHTLKIYLDNFTDLHAVDAIDDSVSGPFSWKNEIVKCISWPKALQRIWRKLQIRGVIGSDAFPLSEAEAEVISKEQFIELLKTIRKNISHDEVSWQKKQAYMEAYRSVPTEVLDGIRHVYAKEFALFDYDDRPGTFFDRTEPFKFYGFLNYSNIDRKIHL